MATNEIKGLDKLLRLFEKAEDDVLEGVNAAIDDWANDTARYAVERVPTDFGKIKQSITPVTTGEFDAKVTAGGQFAPYAPYVEFGTGPFAASYVASLPDDWQELASAYYVNGQGRMPARPYLYPAALRATNAFQKKITELLKQVGK